MKHAHPSDSAYAKTGPKDEDLCVEDIRQGQQMMHTCVLFGGRGGPGSILLPIIDEDGMSRDRAGERGTLRWGYSSRQAGMHFLGGWGVQFLRAITDEMGSQIARRNPDGAITPHLYLGLEKQSVHELKGSDAAIIPRKK